MSDTERQLAEDRQTRASARALFDQRLAQVKSDLGARGIAGRIKHGAASKGADAMAQGLDVARENKGVVAATGVALTLWFFRNPLLALLRRLSGADQHTVQDQPSSDEADNEE